MDWPTFLLYLAVTALVSGGGAYFGSYLKAKGKNLATREDIQGVAEQVSAVKEIETKFLNETWDRQKRWELKRETLLDATKRLTGLGDALGEVSAAYKVREKQGGNAGVTYDEMVTAANQKWFTVKAQFDESKLVVDCICSAKLRDAFDRYGNLATENAYELSNGDTDSFMRRAKEIMAARDAVRDAIREELAIE